MRRIAQERFIARQMTGAPMNSFARRRPRSAARPCRSHGANDGANQRLERESCDVGERGTEDGSDNHPARHVAGEVVAAAVQRSHRQGEGEGGQDQRQVGEPITGAPLVVEIEDEESEFRRPRPAPDPPTTALVSSRALRCGEGDDALRLPSEAIDAERNGIAELGRSSGDHNVVVGTDDTGRRLIE